MNDDSLGVAASDLRLLPETPSELFFLTPCARDCDETGIERREGVAIHGASVT